MIFDHRRYTCKPGSVPLQLALYEQYGKAPQEKHLGKPVLYGITETGAINTYIHVWAYEDSADRAKRRAAMQADPDWQDFLKRSAEAGYLLAQENQILTPAPWFELKR
ncbi:MAG: NIPSNAP family protein [Pseudomonadota bacterium]